MSDGTVLAYLYDRSFEGFLTSVFEAYARRQNPDIITVEENLQVCFGQQVERIATDAEKAQRVVRGITEKIGSPAYQTIWTAFLSGEPDKETRLYHYIRTGLQIGRRIYNSLARDEVLRVNTLYDQVTREAHKYKGFVRFSRLDNDVFYGKINPKSCVVPLLMPHFADRLNIQPFLLYDAVHHIAGVYDLKQWYLAETDWLELPELSADEIEYRRLWKQFYESLTIRERYNPKVRRSFMPKRYWPDMTEMNFVETPAAKRWDKADGLRGLQ